ncbi:hypothetical protein Hanom_Chr10g00885051 [Helianthus anomalus]
MCLRHHCLHLSKAHLSLGCLSTLFTVQDVLVVFGCYVFFISLQVTSIFESSSSALRQQTIGDKCLIIRSCIIT